MFRAIPSIPNQTTHRKGHANLKRQTKHIHWKAPPHGRNKQKQTEHTSMAQVRDNQVVALHPSTGITHKPEWVPLVVSYGIFVLHNLTLPTGDLSCMFTCYKRLGFKGAPRKKLSICWGPIYSSSSRGLGKVGLSYGNRQSSKPASQPTNRPLLLSRIPLIQSYIYA